MIRLHQIDLLRGLIIIFMIIDHAMVYCIEYAVSDPIDVVNTEAKIFFTRFTSHFCAPLFVFLAGLSAAMTEGRYASPQVFAKDIIIRGLVLILLEFTLVSWSWSFNPLFPMLYAQVIWAIGWGFVFLGLFHLVSIKLVLFAGLLLVFAHNLLDGVRFPESSVMHYLWSVLHQKNVLLLPFDFKVRTTYPISPIVGLMCLGYLFGKYKLIAKYTEGSSNLKLNRFIPWYGFACLIGYVVLRGFNIYGDPGDFVVFDSTMMTVMSFLNPTKYPLSLQFMLLTVGVGLLLLSLFSKFHVDFSKSFLQTLGKTSMFSYIMHLYLLHAISWILIPVLGYQFSDMTYNETLIGLPKGYGFSYFWTLVFTAVVVGLTTWLASLYLPWKGRHKEKLVVRYI